MSWRRVVPLLIGLGVLGCAQPPRPTVMKEVDAVRVGAAAKEAELLAPQAYAHAELLKSKAEAAYREKEPEGAQALSERAIAAYTRAFVLARIVKSEKRLASAKAELTKVQSELGQLDEQQKRVAAEADALELKIKVARDALPLVPNAATAPEREAARLEAAKALSTEARLLCVATQMIAPKTDGLAQSLLELGKLDAELAKTPEATPIDRAIAIRSKCLRHLTHARRAATKSAPEGGAADKLLAQLSDAGYEPVRDDRGIVVSLHAPLSRGKLSAAANKALEALARVHQANPKFPLLVVLHTPRGAQTPKAATERISNALSGSGKTQVRIEDAGGTQPVLGRKSRGALARNHRLEIVFVAGAN